MIESYANFIDSTIFLENFFLFSKNLLTDQVYLVRESACKSIKNVLVTFKFSDKIVSQIIEKVNEMKNNQNYLIRNTLLLLIKEFLKDENCTEFVEKKLIETLTKLSKDKMANVRMNTASIIKELKIKLKSSNLKNEVCNLIDILKKDSDIDVLNTINDLNF